MSLSPSRAALLSFLCVACGSEAPSVRFQAELPAEGPVVTLAIALLPFDPQAILDSLAEASATPEPVFETLMTELEAYAPPNEDVLVASAAPWQALRDSLTTIADSLNTVSSGSPEYRRLFRRFRRMQPRLAVLAAERDSILDGLIGAHRALAKRAQIAAKALREWEETAFASYESLATAALEQSGREALTIRTDSSGTAHADLEPGPWWAVARSPDPSNPYFEYSWNVGFTVTGWLPVHVPLRDANARHRWRH